MVLTSTPNESFEDLGFVVQKKQGTNTIDLYYYITVD